VFRVWCQRTLRVALYHRQNVGLRRWRILPLPFWQTLALSRQLHSLFRDGARSDKLLLAALGWARHDGRASRCGILKRQTLPALTFSAVPQRLPHASLLRLLSSDVAFFACGSYYVPPLPPPGLCRVFFMLAGQAEARERPAAFLSNPRSLQAPVSMPAGYRQCISGAGEKLGRTKARCRRYAAGRLGGMHCAAYQYHCLPVSVPLCRLMHAQLRHHYCYFSAFRALAFGRGVSLLLYYNNKRLGERELMRACSRRLPAINSASACLEFRWTYLPGVGLCAAKPSCHSPSGVLTGVPLCIILCLDGDDHRHLHLLPCGQEKGWYCTLDDTAAA